MMTGNPRFYLEGNTDFSKILLNSMFIQISIGASQSYQSLD